MTEFREKWFTLLTADQKIAFIESSVRISDSKGNTFPLVLAPFQRKWLEQGPLFTDFRLLTKFRNRIALKCRNVGASYIMIALEAVLTCWLYEKVTIPFIASTEDQTKVLISSCINLISDLAFDVELLGGIKNQTKSEIKFANGSRIKSFSSNPSGMRGTRALCLTYNTTVLTDVGSVPIGDIVTKGIGTKVLSYNHDNDTVEWKPIVNRMKNALDGRSIVNITDNFSCTEDHPIFNGVEYESAKTIDKVYKLESSPTKNGSYSLHPHILRRTDNSRVSDGGRGSQQVKWSEEEHNISYDRVFKTQGLYDVEEFITEKTKPTLSVGKIGIYRETNNDSVLEQSIPVSDEILQHVNGYWEEKDISGIYGFSWSGSSGNMVHGRWVNISESTPHKYIDTFVHTRGTQNNNFLVSKKMDNNTNNSTRQKKQLLLPRVSSFGTSEIIQNNISTYTQVNGLQNIQKTMQGMQSNFFPNIHDKHLFKGLSKEKSKKNVEYSVQEKKRNGIKNINMCNMSKFLQIKKNRQCNLRKPDMSTQKGKQYEKHTTEKEEEYVYNISVEGNENYFADDILTHNCVYLDEFAHVSDDQGIYDAVNYFIQEGGQLSVLSTPYGKQNLYWRIWSDRDSYPRESWFRVDIKPFTGTFDINKSLKTQHLDGDIELLIPWLNLDKTDADRKADAHNGYANFMQEMLGIPLEEVTAVITTELLNTVTRAEFRIDGRLDQDERTYAMGVDYGASNNMTAAVTSVFEEGRIVVCGTQQFSGNVDVQIDEIVDYVNLYEPGYYYGDATGLGGRSFQDILGSRAVKAGMIIGVDYSKKDIGQRYGSNVNNKEFMINRTLELFARGKIIVPHCFRELRLQLLGVRKYVFEKHIKYSGKDSLTKNDDLAMAFFQMVLAYDMHYGMEDIEGVSAGRADWFNRDSKPKFKKIQYHEGGSYTAQVVPTREKGAFSRLG